MKRILLSLVCCSPLVFNASAVQSIDIIGPDQEIQVLPGQYGPIATTETLWAISNTLRPDNNVSVYQTLMAIYKLNPDAFFEGDVNKIISDSVIDIPSRDFIAAQTDQEALALLKAAPVTSKKTNSNNKIKPSVAPVKNKVTTNNVASNKAAITKTVTKNKTSESKKVDKVVNSKTTLDADKKTIKNTPPVALPAVVESKKAVQPVVEETKKSDDFEKKELSIALEKAKKVIAEQEHELFELNEQLLNVTEMNQRLKLKIQPLSDQIKLLGEQIEKEVSVQEELQALIQEYRQQIDSFAKPPFSGDGAINKVLQMVTSSVGALLLTIISPLLLLIAIFVMLMRLKSKREFERQEQEMAESTATLMEESGKFDSLLTDDLDGSDDLDDDFDDEIDFSEYGDTGNVAFDKGSEEVVNTEDEPAIVDAKKRDVELSTFDESDGLGGTVKPEEPFEEFVGSEDDPFGIGALTEDDELNNSERIDRDSEFDIDDLMSGKEETIELSDVDLAVEDESTQDDLDLAAEWEAQLAGESGDESPAELILNESETVDNNVEEAPEVVTENDAEEATPEVVTENVAEEVTPEVVTGNNVEEVNPEETNISQEDSTEGKLTTDSNEALEPFESLVPDLESDNSLQDSRIIENENDVVQNVNDDVQVSNDVAEVDSIADEELTEAVSETVEETPEANVDDVQVSNDVAEMDTIADEELTEAVTETVEETPEADVDDVQVSNDVAEVDSIADEELTEAVTETVEETPEADVDDVQVSNDVTEIDSTEDDFLGKFETEDDIELLSETELSNRAEDDIELLAETELKNNPEEDIERLAETQLTNDIDDINLDNSAEFDKQSTEIVGDGLEEDESSLFNGINTTPADELDDETVNLFSEKEIREPDEYDLNILSDDDFTLDENKLTDDELADQLANEFLEKKTKVDDFSEFENVDTSELKNVEESLSALDEGKLSDHDQLAKQLGNVAFNEDVPLPSIDKNDSEFIDINTLLENDIDNDMHEDEFNLDIGLDEFPDVVDSFSEFTTDEGGISAQLDLARAYLEIDEKNGANEILTTLLDSAEGEELKEVQKLLKKIN